ncbi:MAG: hypothetical protein G01um101417_133 [Parcubacteria group bacterium Gr01-1014_17]|nr:MAG: hypothetical protein G01um101417_133 [Parcubacteria group bacterium Gr01-1014_17]
MSELFASAELTAGQLNALVKNLMRQTQVDNPNEAVRLVNSGEWIVTKQTSSWREQDGVIHFSVTSDGTTGEAWITKLESKGFSVGDYAKQVLRSPDFKPTSSVTTEVAVLKGTLFKNEDRITKNIRAEADTRKLSKPNAEMACLIREKFTDKEIEAMGLWYIVAMHEPINDSDGYPNLLRTVRVGDGQWLGAYFDGPGGRWDSGGGFAFAVPQVQSSASENES